MNALVKEIKNEILTDKNTALWYLGQVGFIVKSRNSVIAIDPYLSDYVDKNCCSKDVLWERLYPAPCSGSDLSFLDAVICTHAHFDHADPWTLSKIAKANPNTKFIVPTPIVETIAQYGIDINNIIYARAGKVIELGDFKITPVPSAHEEFHIDENGDYFELGYIIDDGVNKIFHAGDMCPYDGLISRIKQAEVVILPVNGRDDERRSKDIIGNFLLEEAVSIANELSAFFIPVHHDLYAINGVEPEKIINSVKDIAPSLNYKIFKVGEKLLLNK